jgi:hypothetical protein
VGLADIFFWLLLGLLVAVVVLIIARSSIGGGSGGGSGIAAMTAFHDLAPSDKQRAIEIIVEKKAGKKWMEQESGKKKDEDRPADNS